MAYNAPFSSTLTNVPGNQTLERT